MPLQSQPTVGARLAWIYVTVGSIACVVTATYYFTIAMGNLTPVTRFVLLSIFLVGAVLILLGLVLGPLGRAARKADLPPGDAIRKEAAIQQTAAATPNAMVPGAGGQVGMAPGMVPGMAPGAMPVNPAMQQPAAPPGVAPAAYPRPAM